MTLVFMTFDNSSFPNKIEFISDYKNTFTIKLNELGHYTLTKLRQLILYISTNNFQSDILLICQFTKEIS